jgi:hypothetical protein
VVLQKLDQCSLACAAVTCSQLSNAALAAISKVSVHCSTLDTYASFSTWMQQHTTSLPNLTQCSISSTNALAYDAVHLINLPCPQLRQLHLQNVRVQLEPADGCPGVLHDCSDLEALDLTGCDADDVRAAAALMPALPRLRSIVVDRVYGMPDIMLSEGAQLSVQLTHLSLDMHGLQAEEVSKLSQLSGLVNLQHLKLVQIPGLPGGLPSQPLCLTAADEAHMPGRHLLTGPAI